MRNPYLTTDASMATNVEDKADKRPPEIQKQVKKKQQKKRQTGCISLWKFWADKILGAFLTGYCYIDNEKICSKTDS